MAISRLSLCDRAYLRLVTAGKEVSMLRLDGMVGQALELLGKRVAMSDGYEGMQKSYSLTITSGVGDLTTLAAALFDKERAIVFPPSSTTRAVPVSEYDDLIHGGLPIDIVYFAQTGTSLRFRDTAGSLTALTGTATVWSNFIPAITDITTQYEAALVETLIEIAAGPQAHPEEVAVSRV